MRSGLSKEGKVQQTRVTTRMTFEKDISVYCQDTFFPLFSASILDNFQHGLLVQRGHYNFPDTGDHLKEQVCGTENNFLDSLFPKYNRAPHEVVTSCKKLIP